MSASSRLLIAALLAVPSLALASNQDSVLLGNDAAMTAGSVTAMVADPSAAWYNPAGLALIHRNAIDLSATGILIRPYSIPTFFQGDLSGGPVSSGVDFTEFLTVSSALVFARSLGPNTTAAVGLFVPTQSDRTGRADLGSRGSAVDPTFSEVLTLTQIAAEYYVGPSIGFALSDDLRIGVSLFGVYVKQRDWFTYTLDATPAGSMMATHGQVDFRDFITGFGLRLEAGFQWTIVGPLSLGVVVRSPLSMMTVSQDYQLSIVPTPMNPPGSPPAFSFGRPIEPLRLHLALSCAFAGGFLSAEADAREPLHDFVDSSTDHWVVNFRAGGKFPISERVSLGAGLFTDFSFDRTPASITESSVDYYGGTAGLEYKTRFEIKDRPAEEAVVVSTTLALRYALGTGQVAGQIFPGPNSGQPNLSGATFQEFSLHIGSALYF
jgi:hypothetical protein